jgi:peptide/nickel transport system substrate-binding protein
MLAEAGWRDEDGDGVLEAHGALHAEDGTPFRFTLYTNSGNDENERMGVIIQDQLGQIGVEVDFQVVDFNVLVDIINAQEYDAYLLAWFLGWPDNPDSAFINTPENDIPGSGFNAESYTNPRVTELLNQARTVPGCDIEERAALYREVQQILQEDQRYLFLYAPRVMIAARGDLENFEPFPNVARWNIDTWSIARQS